MSSSPAWKVTRSGVAVMVMVGAAIAVLGFTLARPAPPAPAAPPAAKPVVRGAEVAALLSAPRILFKRMSGSGTPTHLELAALADPSGPRGSTTLECDRASFSGARGICLQTERGMLTPTYKGVIFDARFQPVMSVKLDGAPTRTRVSPDGRYGAMTVFVTGQQHGYNSVSFSTKTTLVEMATGQILGELEQFKTTRDGQPFAAKDFNFWGVTFARDSNVFYATLMTSGKTYLVKGAVDRREFTVLRENVECPSLSPDNRLIAYKKRAGGERGPWRFHVLDLTSMTEWLIAGETRSIDDQLEWLDDSHVLYAAARSPQSLVTDIWVAPVTGSEPARPLMAEAENPVVVR